MRQKFQKYCRFLTSLLQQCYKLGVFFLSAWRIRPSSPTGRLRLCSAQILWPLSPLSPACCLQEKMERPSSPARTQTTAACPPSSPTRATAERHPATGTARVSAPTHCPPSSPSSHPSTPPHHDLTFSVLFPLSKVRQVFTSPSLLSNLQLLDGPGSHSLSSPYNPPASSWSSSTLSKTPLHSHTPTSLYTPGMTSSFTTSRDGYSSPSREGRESPRLQEALKAERLSPLGGSGASSSFLNLTPAAGSVYTPSSHSHPHMLSPYSSYMTGPQEYNSAALYSSPGAWISPSYSPKLHNKMRISTPGENAPTLSVWSIV